MSGDFTLLIEALERLAGLHAAGLLTERDYEDRVAEVLRNGPGAASSGVVTHQVPGSLPLGTPGPPWSVVMPGGAMWSAEPDPADQGPPVDVQSVALPTAAASTLAAAPSSPPSLPPRDATAPAQGRSKDGADPERRRVLTRRKRGQRTPASIESPEVLDTGREVRSGEPADDQVLIGAMSPGSQLDSETVDRYWEHHRTSRTRPSLGRLAEPVTERATPSSGYWHHEQRQRVVSAVLTEGSRPSHQPGSYWDRSHIQPPS